MASDPKTTPPCLTAEERARLQAAVAAVNQEMADLMANYGETILIRPYCQFDDFRQVALLVVEVHTGREVFR